MESRTGFQIGLTIAALWYSIAATADSTIEVGTALSPVGGGVTIPVTLTSSDYVAALQLDVLYDSTVLSVPGAVQGGTAFADHNIASNVLTPGVLRVVVYSPTNTALGSGTIANIPFSVALDAVAGSEDLLASGDVLADDIANLVSASLVDGSVEIVESATETDLQVSKEVSTLTVTPGGAVSYTVTVTNAGSVSVTDALVLDTIPPGVQNAVWSCVSSGGSNCTIVGVGSISDTVSLAAGGMLTYTIDATFRSNVSGNVTNTAQVFPPIDRYDVSYSNNLDSATSEYVLTADLAIDKQSVEEAISPSGLHHYTIVAQNLGPDDVMGARVNDTFDAVFSSVSWTCETTVGADCGESTGTGNISALVDLAAGSAVTFNIETEVSADAFGDIANTAFVTLPVGVTVIDGFPSNNIDQVVTPVGEEPDLIFENGFESE